MAKPGHEQQTNQTDGHLVADRYRLLARIGSGRLGEIYEAVNDGYRGLGVQRRVALQLLPDRVTLDKKLFNDLKLGYTVLRAAPHPNIVPILEFDHDGKFGYLVMDFLEGASLRLILDDTTKLPFDEAIPILRAIGNALQFLHAKSIVQGRLTAENVFITDRLDVRLLDIVPLDSASKIHRGVAARDPFSRCDVADDVYGLACLAYEMLTGKHPFNFHAPAEARHAGLEPIRIESLPEKQWNALSRSLSFDPEQRTPTVADFIREFGIKGTERLRPSEDAAAKQDSSPNIPKNEVPPTTHSAASSNSNMASAPGQSATRAGPIARSEDALEVARAKGKRAGKMPSPGLVIFLVGLGAWFFYGQPRDDVTALIGYVDSYLAGESPESGDGDSPIVATELAVSASGNAGSANVVSATAPESVAGDDAREETTSESPVAEETVSSEIVLGETDQAAPEPADEQLADSEADTPLSNDDAATDELAGTSDIDRSSRSEPESTLIQSVVYVSERDGAARIATRHPGNTVGQIVWWTSDDTAISEKDYIPIAEPVEGFASGEEAETLHIPLINDSLPEPPETFYVYLGRHDAPLGRLEPISSFRVEINDDD